MRDPRLVAPGVARRRGQISIRLALRRVDPGFEHGHMKPYLACGWNDTESAAGLPNHSCATGALTFSPPVPSGTTELDGKPVVYASSNPLPPPQRASARRTDMEAPVSHA